MLNTLSSFKFPWDPQHPPRPGSVQLQPSPLALLAARINAVYLTAARVYLAPAGELGASTPMATRAQMIESGRITLPLSAMTPAPMIVAP